MRRLARNTKNLRRWAENHTATAKIFTKSSAAAHQDCRNTCALCNKIMPALDHTPGEHVSVTLGRFDELCTLECDIHGPLLDWLRDWFKDLEAAQMLHVFRSRFSSVFYFDLGDHLDRQSPQFDVVGSPQQDQCTGFGVEIDPNWIDDSTLIRWYNNCVETHQQCRNPRYMEWLPVPEPTYLIDTAKNCLAPALPDSCYLCLSYVWGKAEVVKTVKSNLEHLQTPGVLDGSEKQVSLPRTVRHAMHLTRLLGERYLWVDSLCIVQDDEESQNQHLNRMASIYAYANAVIIPVDGEDAEYGIRGLKNAPSAHARHFNQEIIPFGDKRILRLNRLSHEKVYFSRGWTFQEFLFARRRICFQNDSVRFHCCHQRYFEDHAYPERSNDERDWILDVGYPSLTVYSRLATDFNRRHLTYPQDCLSAIAGMYPLYNKVFPGGFLCGLPEMFFDAALLWNPGRDLKRRVPVETGKRYRFVNDFLPSWSWVGWQGEMDFRNWNTANDFIAGCSGRLGFARYTTTPLTTWCTSNDALGMTEKRIIEVSWSTWRDRYRDPANELPAGWKKRSRRPSEPFTNDQPPEGYGDFIYSHKSCGKSPRFWYPIPLSELDTRPHLSTQTAFLHASVQTARLYAAGSVCEYPWARRIEKASSIFVTLVNSQKEWAGILQPHSRNYFSEDGLDPAERPVELQLIAISQGSVPNGLNLNRENYDAGMVEYLAKGRPKDGDAYEFYNVMWISWRGGIAFREALGRVHKGMWESLDTSTIDIVLG